MRCTLLVNIWNVDGASRGGGALQVEVSAQEVEFCSVPASGDRLRAGSLGHALELLMGLPTVDRVEHAPKLPFDGGFRDARTVVVVNLALLPRITDAELDRISDAGWTVIPHLG